MEPAKRNFLWLIPAACLLWPGLRLLVDSRCTAAQTSPSGDSLPQQNIEIRSDSRTAVDAVSSAGFEHQPPFVAAFDRFARSGDVDSVTAGRLLLNELSCTACHTTENAGLSPKRGPRLDGAGNRLNHDWIARFLAGPQEVKHGSTMPAMLNGLSEEVQEQSIRALVAFLATLTEPFPEIKGTGRRPVPGEFWKLGDPANGRRLYHRLGCVACHEPDQDYETVVTKATPLDELLSQLDPEELREAGLLSAARPVESVPLGDPAQKYTRQSLTHFLRDPHRIRPGGRMPDFQLRVMEAADIAAWLLREQSAVAGLSPGADVTSSSIVSQGRQLFSELRCSSCHAVDGLDAPLPATSLKHLDLSSRRQCIDSESHGLPQFSLDGPQLAAIRSAIEDARTEHVSAEASDQLQLTMLTMNCLACHERDRYGGVGRNRKGYFETSRNVDIGDEGRLPPSLTGAGRKLKTGWTELVLQGKGSLRSHMSIRMPVFSGPQINRIPLLLAATDSGGGQPTEDDVFGDLTDLAEAGRELLDVGCVQCHSLRGEVLPGVIGTELEGVAERVHPQWFHDFLLNPVRLKERTRMPSFFPGGRSQNSAVLDGNPERQIAAMWMYLKGIENYPLPAKLEQARSQQFELKPADRPVLLRTFMERVGTYAIAVGFPQRVHFAYDAEQIRPALAWRGRFLDAQSTWFNRFAPPANPLSTDAIDLPEGVSLAFLNSPDDAWPLPMMPDSGTGQTDGRFLGFRLDRSGIPVFRYRIRHVDVEDRMVPGDQQLIRRLHIKHRAPAERDQQLWLRSHRATTLERVGNTSCRSQDGLTVTLDDGLAAQSVLRDTQEGMEWIVPLSFDQELTLEVQYRW
ncbi:MAG: cytochrome c [Fuerstiella sp.]|nr:cytochrome c [Fuerstiella sp.]